MRSVARSRHWPGEFCCDGKGNCAKPSLSHSAISEPLANNEAHGGTDAESPACGTRSSRTGILPASCSFIWQILYDHVCGVELRFCDAMMVCG